MPKIRSVYYSDKGNYKDPSQGHKILGIQVTPRSAGNYAASFQGCLITFVYAIYKGIPLEDLEKIDVEKIEIEKIDIENSRSRYDHYHSI